MKNLFSWLIFALASLAGQAAEYDIRRLTNSDGLSNSSVNMIFQDRTGRVWFGTWDGLDCYNGLDIRCYFASAEDRATLANNVIREMVELPDGTLWVATDRGIDRFDPWNKKFYRYFSESMRGLPVSENSFHLVVSPDSELRAVVNGHGVFDFTNGDFVRRAEYKTELVHRAVMDGSGQLWMHTQDGRALCDGELRSEKVAFLFLDSYSDTVWVQDEQSYHIVGREETGLRGLTTIRAAGTDGVFHYLGTDKGLYRWNPSDGEIRCILPDVPVLSVMCGSQQIIWVGTDMQGVWQLSPMPFDFGAVTGCFENSAVRCFASLGENEMLAGTKGAGVYLLRRNQQPYRHISTKDGLLHNAVYSMADDGDLIWIGSDGAGLNYLDKSDRRLHTLSLPDSLRICSVYALLPDGPGSLWVGTSGQGLFHLSLVRRDGRMGLAGARHYTPAQLGSEVVYSLLPALDGSTIVGTRGAGLLQIGRDGTIHKTDLGTDDILCLLRGRDNALWAGSSMGLFRFGDTWNDIRRFTLKDGLPNNTIHGVLEDVDGGIWASTNNGLAHLDPSDGKIITYQATDGLQDNEFSDGAALSCGSSLLFGGLRGLNWFEPHNIVPEAFVPNLVLDEVFIDNTPVVLDERLKDSAEGPWLVLDPGTRSVSFRFVPVDFLSGDRCELMYRMEGLDRDWVRLGNSTVVAFSSLPPRDYVLRVRCSSSDLVWSEQEYVLRIRMMAPWWKTPLAKFLYALAALLVLSLIGLQIYSWQNGRKRSSEHEAKLDFFTNIAHEFSNSLTLIYGPCIALQQSAAFSSGSQQRYLAAIQSNSDRMRSLIQQLIHFRQAETGHLSIRIGRVDLVSMIAGEMDYFKEQLSSAGIRFRLDCPPEGVIWTADGDSMEKISFNLLSNAVKYTPPGEQILIRLDPKEDKLFMDVTNTGVGIAEDKRASLFDRYAVLDRFERALAKGRTSNGIGLALCKSLVDLHKGTIKILSDGSSFTTFRICLPKLPVEDDSSVFHGTQQNRETPAAAPARNPMETDLHKDNVLVVDDDSLLRGFLKDTLQAQFNVLEAGNGKEALSVLEKSEVKAIVSDLVMPEMDGRQLLNALRANERTRHIPFVLLSAQGTTETPIDALEGGADAYLEKPFDPRYLMARIGRLLGRDNEVIAYSRSALSSIEQFEGREMKKSDRELLTAITDVIIRNMDNEKLTGEWMAKEVSLSQMQVYRKLKALTGMSPTEYIRHIRMENAGILLSSTHKTVQEVMYACGFVTKTYFYREFTKHFGCPPGAFRGKVLNKR